MEKDKTEKKKRSEPRRELSATSGNLKVPIAMQKTMLGTINAQ